MRPSAHLFALALALLFASTLTAAPKALLIGVNAYEAEGTIAPLKGPSNDVKLMREALEARGVADIRILADGIEGAKRPTRAAIMAELADLAKDAEDGDFIVIHFSGHGSRQRDQNGDEADGWDELILPIDTGPSQQGSGIYPNAITDDEIGAAVDAIAKSGADVWLILDSCYSGTALRGGNPAVVARYVPPAHLGTADAPQFATGPAFSDADLPATSGNVIAFYAAQANEKAHEFNLAPAGAEEAWYGHFTSRLAAQMQSAGSLSFRQLFQATLHAMNGPNMVRVSEQQTPFWEGDLIDRPLLGSDGAPTIQRYPLQRGAVLAGQIHGLPKGTLLGLVAGVADAPDALVGLAQIERPGPALSRLRPVAEGCVANAEALCPRAGRLPKDAQFAQVLARPLDLIVRIAPPLDAAGSPLAVEHPAYAALAKAIAETERVTLDSSNADINVLWDGTALWFGPRTMIEDQPIGLRWQPETEPLVPLIDRIERATSLAKLLRPLTAPGSMMMGPRVVVTADLEPVRLGDIAAPEADVSPGKECAQAAANRDPGQERQLKDAEALKQCDTLRFSAQPAGPGVYDVNRIWIDSQFCVHPRYKRVENFTQATKIGPSIIVCSDCPGGYSAGEEQMFFIISEVQAGTVPFNLRGQLENCGDSALQTRGQTPPAVSYLRALAGVPNLRGFGGPAISVAYKSWTVLPKPVVLRGRDVSH